MEDLKRDRSYLTNEFNKFLIECSFPNKEQFAVALGALDPLELWREIQAVLQDTLRCITIVKENRKDYLLSILYCCHMPKILEHLASIRSIFDEKPIEAQLTESYLGDTSIESGRNVLQAVF